MWPYILGVDIKVSILACFVLVDYCVLCAVVSSAEGGNTPGTQCYFCFIINYLLETKLL